jgi:hypothetical protein
VLESRVDERRRLSRFPSLPTSVGTAPLMVVCSRVRPDNLPLGAKEPSASAPICVGMLPASGLCASASVSSDSAKPSSVGILPTSEALLTSKVLSNDRRPSCDGNSPPRGVSTASIEMSELMAPISVGKGPSAAGLNADPFIFIASISPAALHPSSEVPPQRVSLPWQGSPLSSQLALAAGYQDAPPHAL